MDQASAAAVCTQTGGKLVHLSDDNDDGVELILLDNGKLPPQSLVVSHLQSVCHEAGQCGISVQHQ